MRRTVEFGWEDDPRLTTLVVDAIAEMAAVDPDSLDELFRARFDGGRRTGGRIEFELQGLDVTVHGDGLLEAERPESQSTVPDDRAE